MRAIEMAELRDNFSGICNMAAGGETFVVSRPRGQNVVILSEKDYNEIIKARQNAEYMAMLDKSFQELEEGKVVVKTIEELESMTDG